jgi:superfamily II DNA/RNA helicase
MSHSTHTDSTLETGAPEEVTTFFDLGLGNEILRALTEVGYERPTPIQAQGIPIVFTGRDILGSAQTGTGKTASFTLPMIEMLSQGRARARMPRSLILEPTRELAAQVAENFDLYGKHHKLSKALIIGGESMSDQERLLERGVDVLIATPGRLLDLFERGRIILNDVKILVIDEADRMLDMGFIPDVEKIVSLLSPLRQTLFFSATMPPEIKRLADKFLSNPKVISVSPPATPGTNISQHLVIVEELDKREALRRLIRSEEIKNALIFCNRKKDVRILCQSLNRHGMKASELHGDMAQSARTEALDAFRRNDTNILVCSDVAARGIDIDGLSHVFNFDVPHHCEDYVHRIGRTGRAGREGRAFTLASPDDTKFVESIEGLIGSAITRIEVPGLTGAELGSGERGDRRPGRGGRDRGRGRGRDRGPERKENVESRVETPSPIMEAPLDSQPERIEFPPPRPEHHEQRTERGPRPERPERGPRPERPERGPRPERPERGPHPERPERGSRPPREDRPREDRRPRRDDDDLRNERVVGFGDSMPAFMRHPVILPGAPKPAAPIAAKPGREKQPVVEIEIAVEAPVVEAEAALEVEATPVTEKPKRKRAPRKPTTRKPKAAKEEAAIVETTAESAPSEE